MNPTTDFATFRAIRPEAGFCDWLRQSSGPLWAAMVGHRFTQDMAGDRLPHEAFLRYLRYEHAFVRTAILIFAQALIKAPAAADRVELVGVLGGLTGEQEAYFQDRFKALELPGEAVPDGELPSEALALSEGALAIAAQGCFEEILSAMLAAEWIELHVAPGFTRQVAWLKARLEALGPLLDPGRQQRCANHFARMLRLEIAFHDAPYADGAG